MFLQSVGIAMMRIIFDEIEVVIIQQVVVMGEHNESSGQ